MLTLPAILTDYARGNNGGGYVYALSIEPSAPDGWTAKRYSTASVTIDGDEYAEAIAKNISRITQRARIIQSGAAAIFPDLTVKLINKDSLHEDFVVNNVVNRKARILMTAISSNKCLNSSFELATAGVADSWTGHPSGLGGSYARVNTQHHDALWSTELKSTNATEGSWMESDEMTYGWLLGEKLWLSAYFKQATTADEIGMVIKVKIGGTWFYYNSTAATWGLGRFVNWVGNAGAAWQRFSINMDWARFYELYPISTHYDNYPIIVEFETKPNEGFYVDAVQVEAWPKAAPTSYHHNRHELIEADDCVTVFTGIIKRPKWKHNEVNFQLEAYQANKHRIIPTEIISDAVSATWKIPRDSDGKPFPITYGDFQANGHTVWDPEESELTEFARGILTNIDPEHADGVLVYFDRPSLKLYKPGGGIFRLYNFCEDNGRYYEQMYNDDGGYSYDSREFEDDFANHPRWKQSSNPYWLLLGKIPLMAYLKALQTHEYDSSWFVPELACDGNILTCATKQLSGNPLDAMSHTIESFPYSRDSIIHDSNSLISIYVLGDFTGTGASGNITLDIIILARDVYYLIGSSAVNIFNNVAVPCEWRNTPIKRTGATNKNLTELKYNITDWAKFSDYFNDYICNAVAENSVDVATTRIHEYGALFFFSLDLRDINYASQFYGRTFQDTWGARKTATNLVESPSEIIESILRLELGCATADIDTTEFDAVHTARSGNKVAGQLHKLSKSQKVIDQICREHGMFYHVNPVGKHSLVTLDYSATAVDTLDMGDFLDPYTKIQISQTPRESVINDIRVYYDKNQFTGDHKKVAYCNKDGKSGSIPASYQTKCSNSYAELGNRIQSYDLKCDWVNDATTAETILKWFIDWNHRQRYIIEGPIFMDKYKVEVGDIVALDISPLLPPSVTASSRFIVANKALDRGKGLINVQLLEVREP